MTQFWAILKDSFREAVDGFVIYLMLALSAVLLVLIASVSFTPDPADDALPEVLGQFNIVFPDRGASRAPTGVPGTLNLRAKDVSQGEGGTIRFTLEAGPGVTPAGGPKSDPGPPNGRGEPPPPPPIAPTGPDMFRYAVVAWKSPAGEKIEDPRRTRNRGRNKAPEKELEVVTPPNATPDDLRRVTDEEMTAFLTNQFVLFTGVRESDVTVTRRPGVPEPNYQFDVSIARVAGARGWPHSVHVFFGAVPPIKKVPLGLSLYFIEDVIVNGIGAAVTLMLSVVITAFFVPNLLRKGSVDLLIAKPIGRAQLLIYKYVGGLTFIFLLSSFTIGGVWLVLAARSGHWDPSFLLVIPALTFTFAILYAVSTLVAVFTRSAIAAILVTLGFMFVMYLLGQVKSFFDMNKVTGDLNLPEWSYTLVDTLNNVLPRYKDLDKLTTKLIADANLPLGLARLTGIFTEFPSWTGAVGVSLAFIALMLALSCWRFGTRDY